MDLTTTERMLLEELVTRRDAALAPIQQRLDAALAAIAERVGVPVAALRIDLSTGAITDSRAAAAATEDEDG